MRLATQLGPVNVEKVARHGNRIQSAIVKVTFAREGDSENVYTLSRTLWQPRRRSEVTAALVRETVAEMIEGRDDLDGHTLRSVEVIETNRIWATPYEDIYPEKYAAEEAVKS